MKKILFMLSSMNIGGVEKSLLSLLSIIPKEKYDITLLLLEKEGGFMQYIPDWVKVEEAVWFKQVKPVIMDPPQRTINDFLNNKEYWKVITYGYSYIVSEKVLKNRYIFYKNAFKEIPKHEMSFDVAISYQGPTDIIDYYVANKVDAIKKITWVHFDVSKHPMNAKLYRKLYKSFDKVYVVSNNGKKELINKIPSILEKTEVFNNIISKQLIHDMSKKEVAFDDTYNGIKIVTVGRLSKEKGQDLAIKALRELRQDGYDAKWYCIGEGKSREEYEQLIEKYDLKDHFILMGSLTNPYPFIAGSDIYVQPSRHEGYCLSLAEARSLNKPIVTTNFIGAKEQIMDGYSGWIVNSAEGLYKKIKVLIKESGKRQRLTENLSNINTDTTAEVEMLLKYIG